MCWWWKANWCSLSLPVVYYVLYASGRLKRAKKTREIYSRRTIYNHNSAPGKAGWFTWELYDWTFLITEEVTRAIVNTRVKRFRSSNSDRRENERVRDMGELERESTFLVILSNDWIECPLEVTMRTERQGREKMRGMRADASFDDIDWKSRIHCCYEQPLSEVIVYSCGQTIEKILVVGKNIEREEKRKDW